jgi:hypothetical protein
MPGCVTRLVRNPLANLLSVEREQPLRQQSSSSSVSCQHIDDGFVARRIFSPRPSAFALVMPFARRRRRVLVSFMRLQ